MLGEECVLITVLAVVKNSINYLQSLDTTSRGFISMKDRGEFMGETCAELWHVTQQYNKWVDVICLKIEVKDLIAYFLYKNTRYVPRVTQQ